jgi:HEAT repeat protein
LNDGYSDKNPDRRKQAIASAGAIGLAPEGIQFVEKGLKDDDYVVRATAAAELGEMKSRQSIPALRAVLDDPSGDVAFAAAKAIWSMQDRSSRATLAEILQGTRKDQVGMMESAKRDAMSKLHSPHALAMIGFREATGALLGPFSIGIIAGEEFLRDKGAPGRALAATLLADDCSPETQQLLAGQMRTEKNNGVKAALAKSIGKCGTKDEIPELEQFLSVGNDAVRFMAAAAIVRLSLPAPPPKAAEIERPLPLVAAQ